MATHTNVMTHTQQTFVSVVICTRNRGSSVVATLDSVLANTHPGFEVVLIDQSTNDRTEQAIQRFRGDERLRYIRSNERGVGRARNVGLREARHELVLYTDDDCTVPPNWIAVMAGTLLRYPRLAMVFSTVAPVPHDKRAGFVPDHEVCQPTFFKSPWDCNKGVGIGASMGVRRSALLNIGSFDESFGPGGFFLTGEETDVAFRLIINGWWVFETPDVVVLHDGFRNWSEFQALTKAAGVAVGARCAKFLKCGRWSAMLIMLLQAVDSGLWRPLAHLGQLRAPRGFKRLLFFVQGFVSGIQTPVDRRLLLYQTSKLS